RFCTASSKRALRVVPTGSLVLQDVNDPAIQARYGITPEAAQREMHLISAKGRMSAGAYAVRDLLRMSRWAWPLARFWRLPGFTWLANRLYSWVADHRYLFMGRTANDDAECAEGSCRVHLGKL
ncbi:MAG TPA: DUF393 domain-containing protein, partial [Chloroflexia bacterium]|nr:DUF393 domain-containing protein [Chloroflexia bacterium]